ncbi:MAG TPA: hypothetical protein VMB85_03300 [Bryobacteraceae bacterium]|nr:hypothetical protein [Bryobacteraceae bacterium]
MRKSSEKRHLCSELVSILYGCGQLISGNLEEIGECSALVLVDSPIRNRSQISIACEKHHLRGVVKSCTFTDVLGYLVEVTLNVDSCWSPRWFTPKHLLHLTGRAA